jgi:hypothetical protein
MCGICGQYSSRYAHHWELTAMTVGYELRSMGGEELVAATLLRGASYCLRPALQ